MDGPLVVEIVNQANWWLPWLPVLGSAIVAAAAVSGVAISNRTNRDAIRAADQRAEQDRRDARTKDFKSWQRDTLLEISSSVVETALSVADEYSRIAHSVKVDAREPVTFGEAARMGNKVGAAIGKLLIMGEHELAGACRVLRTAMNDEELVRSAIALNRYHASVSEGSEPNEAHQRELRARLEGGLATLNQARGDFGELAESALKHTTGLPTEQLNHVQGSTRPVRRWWFW